MEKFTALYCRFAYSDTPEAMEQQEQIVYQFAVTHGFANLKGYIDSGVSGLTMERPAFQELMEDITAGRVACVIAADESRICRRSSICREYLEDIFPSHGVTFYCAAPKTEKSLMDILSSPEEKI